MCENYRKCPECGKTKPVREFWREAKRCWKCVARATARERRERTREWRKTVKKKYGLSLALSERKVGRDRDEANRVAESITAKSGRDTWAKWLANYGPLALLGAVILGCVAVGTQIEYPMWWAAFLVLASGVASSGIAGKLSAPRDAVVMDLTNALLKDRLRVAEAELMEYLRFYTTPDWRVLRAKVILREGGYVGNVGYKSSVSEM